MKYLSCSPWISKHSAGGLPFGGSLMLGGIESREIGTVSRGSPMIVSLTEGTSGPTGDKTHTHTRTHTSVISLVDMLKGILRHCLQIGHAEQLQLPSL